MKKDFCTLYLIRHGETEWNRDHIVMGHSDAPLTEAGIRQAVELAALLRSIDFSAVYSSDSSRAVRTAEIVGGVGSSLVKKSVALRERNFLKFEGMSVAEYREKTKSSRAIKDALPEDKRWNFKIAGCVESDASLVARVVSSLQSIAAPHLGGNILVVTHGGPIRFLLVKLGFAPYGSLPSGSFKNCGYIVVKSDGNEFSVKEVNGIKEHENMGK